MCFRFAFLAAVFPRPEKGEPPACRPRIDSMIYAMTR